MRAERFPLGAGVTVGALEGDPHALLARLRAREPVSWLPALDGWLVTRRDLALAAMRDAATFTVDDPRFTTAQVVGASMLSLDGAEHDRHRAPFVAPLRLGEVRARLAEAVEAETDAAGRRARAARGGELRRGFAGPLAAAAVTHALGLDGAAVGAVLGWYDAIVAAVTDLSAGRPAARGGGARGRPARRGGATSTHRRSGTRRGPERRRAAVRRDRDDRGDDRQRALHLLSDPEALAAVRADPALLPAAVEESLRLEPAAAVIDRYATRDVELAARRSPPASSCGSRSPPPTATRRRSPDPDRFDLARPNASRHLAFAAGRTSASGMHLARLEAHVALAALLERLPGLRLDGPAEVRGLIFRKPPELPVRWDAA